MVGLSAILRMCSNFGPGARVEICRSGLCPRPLLAPSPLASLSRVPESTHYPLRLATGSRQLLVCRCHCRERGEPTCRNLCRLSSLHSAYGNEIVLAHSAAHQGRCNCLENS